jgi:hypothetical protein
MSRHSSGMRPYSDGRLPFAATTMLVVGVFEILLGIMAIVRDTFFVASAHYLYIARVYGWGWVHLGLGALLVLVGLALYTGVLAIRVIAAGLVALSAVTNFLFIPYYPVWSLLIIGFDALLLWAITTGRRAAAPEPMAPGMAYGTAMTNPERWTATNEQPSARGAGARPAQMGEPARTAGGPSDEATEPPAAT